MPKKFSAKQMRIAIARDALAALRLEQIKAQEGVFFRTDCELGETPAQTQRALKALPNKRENCTVCAKGALFLGRIRKFDGFWSPGAEAHEGVLKALRGIFRRTQLDLIESAFERFANPSPAGIRDNYETVDRPKGLQGMGWDWGAKVLGDPPSRTELFDCKLLGDAQDFYDAYPDQRERLLAILRNIVKNDGIFRPDRGRHVIRLKRERAADTSS